MVIHWSEEENILTIDGVPYEAEGGYDGPVEVRVAVLRQISGADLPIGVRVRAVRKVAGSSRDLYADHTNAYFERTEDGGLLVVADLVIVDSDDEPEPDRRRMQIQHEIA